jgi:hypothetical protein
MFQTQDPIPSLKNALKSIVYAKHNGIIPQLKESGCFSTRGQKSEENVYLGAFSQRKVLFGFYRWCFDLKFKPDCMKCELAASVKPTGDHFICAMNRTVC